MELISNVDLTAVCKAAAFDVIIITRAEALRSLKKKRLIKNSDWHNMPWGNARPQKQLETWKRW